MFKRHGAWNQVFPFSEEIRERERMNKEIVEHNAQMQGSVIEIFEKMSEIVVSCEKNGQDILKKKQEQSICGQKYMYRYAQERGKDMKF